MSVKISVTGLAEIDKVVKGLPLQLQDKVLMQAHADAAKPLVLMAKELVPKGKTHNLEKSIGVEKVGIKRTDQVGLVLVGPRRRGGNRGFHGHLIEYGKTNRDGTRTMPDPFMRPAFEATHPTVEKQISTSLGKKVNSFMKRTIKNG